LVNSRQKGKRGELEVVHLLKEYGFEARRGQQFKGTSERKKPTTKEMMADGRKPPPISKGGNPKDWDKLTNMPVVPK
tara:strand:+ start:434 stop:664 length:231 start_codon:yes stop_codon:yes gene_type:complete